MDKPGEVRCFCSRKTLLGKVGRDPETGAPALHIVVHKQGRIFGEIVVTAGLVKLKCRDCLRWHKVAIRHQKVDVQVIPEGSDCKPTILSSTVAPDRYDNSHASPSR